MKKKVPKNYNGKWVLLDKKNKVIFYSENIVDVVKKGREYPKDEVTIEKKLPKGTCFFQIFISHSNLLKFTFKYKGKPPNIPLIPLRFFDNYNKPTPTFNAILDSGADEITIPKDLADLLEYKLTERTDKINTAGGEIKAFKAKGKFNIGRGGREAEYKNIEICVIDHDIPVLVGIKPIFNDYKVTIFAYENKFILEPRNILKNLRGSVNYSDKDELLKEIKEKRKEKRY